MKTIASFDSPEDAYLFRAFLDSRGIEGFIFDEYVAQLCWNYRFASGGVRVVVNEDADLDAATAACDEYFEGLRSKPVEIEEVKGWPIVAVLTLLMGVPMIIFGRRRIGVAEESL